MTANEEARNGAVLPERPRPTLLRSLSQIRVRLALLALFAALAPPAVRPLAAQTPPQTVLYPGVSGQALMDQVRADYRPAFTLGYNVARDSLFAYEQRRTGHLTCVYSGFEITLAPGADPSTDAFRQGINTEHTWPQSMGASAEPSRSDMHHLYPTRENINSSRGNVPYGEIPDPQTDTWYRLAASQTTIPTVGIDEWSEKDNATTAGFQGRFEPRESHEGNAARAVFYYRTMYPERVTAVGSEPFFQVQLGDVLRWARLDAVDAYEAARSSWIGTRQRTAAGGAGVNPFVLDSTLARRIWAPGSVLGEGGAGTGALALRVVGANPVRTTATVALTLAEASEARVVVYDALGRHIATLHDGPLGAGETRLDLDASRLTPGVYVVRALIGAAAATLRVVVTR